MQRRLRQQRLRRQGAKEKNEVDPERQLEAKKPSVPSVVALAEKAVANQAKVCESGGTETLWKGPPDWLPLPEVRSVGIARPSVRDRLSQGSVVPAAKLKYPNRLQSKASLPLPESEVTTLSGN